MSDFCIDCEHYRVGICELRNIYPYPPDGINCDKFTPKAVKTVVLQDNGWGIIEEKKPTLFDRITTSPEVLAEEFVEKTYDRIEVEYRYYSMLTGDFYDTEAEAIAATVAKLKKVEK